MTAPRGLTWDHPRGYGPLDELGGPVEWDRQSLEGFESAPIADLAADYDLLVIDHPGLGDAVTAGALLPLDSLLDPAELEAWRVGTVGACFDSYVWQGRPWAMPIDAATQVAVTSLAEPPQTWAEVVALARAGEVTLCLGGPHALLTFFSLCVAHGATPPEVPRATGLAALETMAEILAQARTDVWRRNPIGVLEAMSAGAARYCPLVYGYVSYSRELTFVDAPTGPAGRGSVLGGTGLAVSRHRTDDPAFRAVLAEQVRRYISAESQQKAFPAAGGQPAARQVWANDEGFYRNTQATVETAWVRPREPGYIGFQTAASAVVRDGLAARKPLDRVLDGVEAEYDKWRKA